MPAQGTLGWKVYFAATTDPVCIFFLLGQLGPAEARGFVLSATEHMGMALRALSHSLINTGGKNEFFLRPHHFPSFDTLSAWRRELEK